MSEYVEFKYCEMPRTPIGFDLEEFKKGNSVQIKLYKDSKRPNRKKSLTYEEIEDLDKAPNFARVVPEGCMFIDFDNASEACEMREIILMAGLKCLMLETTHGYHFLFRKPDFYKKEMTGATNWFGYKFDCKGPDSVQIIKVCGMVREERYTGDITELVNPHAINTRFFDVLPYWLWGKLSDKDLHKGGKPGESEYTLTDTPFTQLMKMREGGRHNHIVERCSHFGITNGFTIPEFKDLIQIIHDRYLVELGTPMPESDLFGDLESRWSSYDAGMTSSGWDYDEKERKWIKLDSKKDSKIDERRAAEYLFNEFDFYGKGRKADGTFDGLLYKEIDGPYDYQTDITKTRQHLKNYSDQNFKETFFKEMEVQLMQMCAANNKLIKRSDLYVIAKNKVMSCISPDAYDFSWLGTRPPTDVVFKWNWYPQQWVEDHREDLGGLITKFIKELSRDASGIPQPQVEQWLWVIAGACMIPANQLQKIVILSGGGQNGKSLYTSLIRLCLGKNMWNESKIFDSNPGDSFWGEELDKGILCVIDDLQKDYNKNSFSYIKGAVTGTDSVTINEKFKPKRKLDVLPQIVACTNNDFELYDKTEGMKRRVKILPTEYHIDDMIKDNELQFKLVLNTTDQKVISDYRMTESAYGDRGVRVMHMYTDETGVIKSLNDGSLAWFANNARYTYMKWLMKELILEDSEGMKDRFEGTFSGGFDAEMLDFMEWYVSERKENIWTKDLYREYVDWHGEMATGDLMMREKAFSMRLNKSIKELNSKGYRLYMKKARNDKGMSLNKIFIERSEIKKKEEE